MYDDIHEPGSFFEYKRILEYIQQALEDSGEYLITVQTDEQEALYRLIPADKPEKVLSTIKTLLRQSWTTWITLYIGTGTTIQDDIYPYARDLHRDEPLDVETPIDEILDYYDDATVLGTISKHACAAIFLYLPPLTKMPKLTHPDF